MHGENQMFKNFKILPALMIMVAQTVVAQGSGDVVSTLSVNRITTNAQRTEIAEPVKTAKPGDVLEYVADYKNNGKNAAKSLEATLPIPVGTEYIPDSARPSASQASVDGATFESLPLKRKVKQADGKLVEQPVPYADYRFLRWPARDLDAGKILAYSTRVKVVADVAPVAVASKK